MNGFYKPGSVAKYRCNRRYRLIGSKKSLCQDNGEWDGFIAKCVRRKYGVNVNVNLLT